jgi:hypothetical protein
MSIMRSRMATTTTWVLLLAPVLRMAERTCASTVLLVMWRISPIARADLPRATHVNTSISRDVRDEDLFRARRDTALLLFANLRCGFSAIDVTIAFAWRRRHATAKGPESHAASFLRCHSMIILRPGRPSGSAATALMFGCKGRRLRRWRLLNQGDRHPGEKRFWTQWYLSTMP